LVVIGFNWFFNTIIDTMLYTAIFLVTLVTQTVSPVSYHPQIDFVNQFNFKWEITALEDSEHIRQRRSSDWRPSKLKVGFVDEEWCTMTKQISVEYNKRSIECANNYKLTGLFDKRPSVKFENQFEDGKYYTLVMLDPDAPSRKNPKFRSWLHWIVINIQSGSAKNGTEMFPYQPPTPPPGSGKHRYIFFLLPQEQRQKSVENVRDRANFDLNKYASQNKISRVSGFLYFTTESKPKRFKLSKEL